MRCSPLAGGSQGALWGPSGVPGAPCVPSDPLRVAAGAALPPPGQAPKRSRGAPRSAGVARLKESRQRVSCSCPELSAPAPPKLLGLCTLCIRRTCSWLLAACSRRHLQCSPCSRHRSLSGELRAPSPAGRHLYLGTGSSSAHTRRTKPSSCCQPSRNKSFDVPTAGRYISSVAIITRIDSMAVLWQRFGKTHRAQDLGKHTKPCLCSAGPSSRER